MNSPDSSPLNSRARGPCTGSTLLRDAPAQARRIVHDECVERMERGTLETLQLLVSELVTTGLVHGRPNRDRSVTLELLINSTLRCAVVDAGLGFATCRPRPQREAGACASSSDLPTAGA